MAGTFCLLTNSLLYWVIRWRMAAHHLSFLNRVTQTGRTELPVKPGHILVGKWRLWRRQRVVHHAAIQSPPVNLLRGNLQIKWNIWIVSGKRDG